MLSFIPVLILSWRTTAKQPVFSRVYEQTVVLPAPHWAYKPITNLVCGVVTIDKLTNNWTIVQETTNQAIIIVPKSDGLLHTFKVVDVDSNTGIESN